MLDVLLRYPFHVSGGLSTPPTCDPPVTTKLPDPAAGRPAEILLVEDSPTDVLLATEALLQAKVINNLSVVKDGVAAIRSFVRALDEGYDIIQGSRYKPGGEAINTPLDRYIAGKLIHAPLISLGARFRFTDTTNGFRGYSAKALRDPRVAPFRDVFANYNLLFYLSVRIPQLGYRACEVPVSRRYPPSGKTPTKIAGVRGRFAMLGEVFDAVRGRFNP